MVKIVTDTLCDIPDELAEKYGISIVPLNLHFGNDVYRDKYEISTDEFYNRLVTSDVFPTSSAPPPGIFMELFTKLAGETDEILAIMVSSKLSAIHESALQGKELVETDCRIEIIDSHQIIGGQLIAVLLAAEAAEAGSNLDEVCSIVNNALPRIQSIMAFDTLEYLKKGGRIGKGQAFLGGLLKLHPVLGLKDGEVVPITRTRNRVQATDFLVDFVKKHQTIERVVIEDATTGDEVEALSKRIGEFVPSDRIFRSKVSPVIGVHVGPHVLAVSVNEG